ncbi:2TM domain-containing protein [Catelliglobosispora koreensis]|uniref:2TM domain-containing protein n=1 Tax=Catelliglobosispora koreensis TaxID=129052 RepID=UPI00035DA27F|nr:2TM domain-containing protein [Catelliglobosispora koreensis]
MTTETTNTGSDLRQLAIARLRKKRELHQHLAVYIVVNTVLVFVWLFTTPGGFFWPMFPLLFWGMGLLFHAMDVYSPAVPSEDRIQREIARLTHR